MKSVSRYISLVSMAGLSPLARHLCTCVVVLVCRGTWSPRSSNKKYASASNGVVNDQAEARASELKPALRFRWSGTRYASCGRGVALKKYVLYLGTPTQLAATDKGFCREVPGLGDLQRYPPIWAILCTWSQNHVGCLRLTNFALCLLDISQETNYHFIRIFKILR
jgi:hypothetical protein